MFHSGYFKLKSKKSDNDGVWSCCGSDERDGEACIKENHRCAEFPDEDAKKYFFDKPLKNPSELKN